MQTVDSCEAFTGILSHDLRLLQDVFDRCSDVVIRTFALSNGHRAAVLYLEGIVDEKRLESDIIAVLADAGPEFGSSSDPEDAVSRMPVDKLRPEASLDAAAASVCAGNAAVLMDGYAGVYLAGVGKWEKRAIQEPTVEPVIRGPRDGFTESAAVNITLLRRRLATPDLKVEAMKVGELSRTAVYLVYLDSVVDKGVLDEARKRIGRIEIDAILESGYIEEQITDNPYSLFPQILSTERPDRVAGNMLEGRVGIIVDNTPVALVAPGTFNDSYISSEDYYQHYIFASAVRLLRFWLSFSALVFPSIYIAVSTYHQEMIPTSLLLSIASSREAVPFPGIVEAILMEAAFEGLREAGIRLPRPVGQAVSIVGALVIGQAAVQAGIVSTMLVIVVSFTGIASFVFPLYSQGLAVRVLRFPLMLLAGTLGLYGLFLGLLMLLVHLAKLRSFGVPYLTPFMPAQSGALRDSLVRAPWWAMVLRPLQTARANRRRMRPGLRPEPPGRR